VSFLVDADIVSAHFRGRGKVTSRLLQHTGRLSMSAVTLAELKTWLYRHNTPQRYRDELAVLSAEFVLFPVDADVAERFGEVGARLLDRGQSCATPDLLIAATALVHDLTLVTGNSAFLPPSTVCALRIGCRIDRRESGKSLAP
jgi:tRNA(fMet)-specific endonuclease VapC